MAQHRTLRSKDSEERVVKKPVGRANAKIVTKLGRLAQGKLGIGSIESPKEIVLEAKAEAKRLRYKVDAEIARKELKQLRGGGLGASVIYPVLGDGKVIFKELKLNPGETRTIGEISLNDKGKEKEKEGKEKKEAVSLVKEVGNVMKTGIEVGKSVGGGKGMNSDEVRKIVEDKLDAYKATVETKFEELKSLVKEGGSKKDIVDTIKDLQELGVIPKKKEGGTEGEGGFLGRLAKEIEMLEKAGLVVPATKVSEKTQQMELDKEKEGMSFWLAARKLALADKKAMLDAAAKKRKTEMFKGMFKELGSAVAEAIEESEEEEEGESEVKGKKEEVIEESEKTPAGIETFICQTEIEPGVKCGAKVSIPPEAQKEGYQLVCPKCGSTYQYTTAKK